MATTNGRKRLLVKQVKEWGEILIGFEAHNRYELYDEHGTKVGFAAEQTQGLGTILLRNLLGHCRASTIHITDAAQRLIAEVRKPFRFYFHRVEAFENGRKVGAVQRRFSILHRKFVIENAKGQEVLTILSPLFQIWTFRLLFGEREVGVISKKWGGLMREIFTDADAFGVEYEDSEDLGALRTVLLAATFLIDFTCFENNANRRGVFHSAN